MKNIIKKIWDYKTYIIILILMLWFTYYTNKLNLEKIQETETKYKLLLEEANKPSYIEILQDELNKTKTIVEDYRKLNEKAEDLLNKIKIKKESSIWKTRCIEKNIIWEKQDCNNNLERFANYNEGLTE